MQSPRNRKSVSSSSERSDSAPQTGNARIACWIAVLLFFFYLFTTSAHQPTGDEEEYVAVAASLITAGTPAISVYERTEPGRTRLIQRYSKYPLGHSLLLIPAVGLQMIGAKLIPLQFGFIPHFFLHAFPAFISAAICALLFLLISQISKVQPHLSVSHSTATVMALTAGFATQLWPASRTFFADNSIAFLLTLAVYALVRFRYAKRAALAWGTTAACAAAMMVLCKTLLVLACPALAVYGICAVRQRLNERTLAVHQKKTLAFLVTLPMLVLVIIQLWYNDLRFGSIWISGYHQGRDGSFGFATPVWVGLYGIFFSSGRSLFLYSPPCLMSFFGIGNFYRYARAELMLVLGIAAPVVAAYAMWWSWHGGWEWGTRFYVFLIPLLIWTSMPAWRWMDAHGLAAGTRNLRMGFFAILIAVSLGIQTLGILVDPMAYWRMTGVEMKVLEYPMYQKGSWEIRDDMPFAHFVPEFSPVAAHAWLIWATWNRHTLDERQLANRAPWVSLNPNWAPSKVSGYLGYDLWFIGEWVEPWRKRGGSLLTLILTALALATMLVVSAGKLLMHLRLSRSPEKPRATARRSPAN
jgi:hypothetical protein